MPEPKRELESEHFPTTSSEQQTDWQERPVSPLPLPPRQPSSMQITRTGTTEEAQGETAWQWPPQKNPVEVRGPGDVVKSTAPPSTPDTSWEAASPAFYQELEPCVPAPSWPLLALPEEQSGGSPTRNIFHFLTVGLHFLKGKKNPNGISSCIAPWYRAWAKAN